MITATDMALGLLCWALFVVAMFFWWMFWLAKRESLWRLKDAAKDDTDEYVALDEEGK